MNELIPLRLKEKHDELYINKKARERFANGAGITALISSVYLTWYFQWGETAAIAIIFTAPIFVYQTILKVFGKNDRD